MDDLTHRVTSKILDPSATPATTISIKVNNHALRSVANKGLKKTNWFERNAPISLRRWVNVESAEHGTDDSVFFAPEHPNVDISHQRTLPAQYIKVNPNEHTDVVCRGDHFEVSFIGMSVAPMDAVGNNEIFLCSLTREENSSLEKETNPELFAPSESEKTSQDTEELEKLKQWAIDALAKAVETNPEKLKQSSVELKKEKDMELLSELPTAPTVRDIAAASAAIISATTAAGKVTDKLAVKDDPQAANRPTYPSANAVADKATKSTVATNPVKLKQLSAELRKKKEMELLSELPTALTVQPQDIPFLHYDPEVDGHDTGSAPDSFVPIPGSKRVYLQRRGERSEKHDVSLRFTLMEVDKLSEEQLIAIKSLDEIGKSVGKAAATVPYLKFISWILKFANFLGRSALKKVAEPEHVLSKDIVFLLSDPVDRESSTSENGNSRPSSTGRTKREQYGNYLRYGYYFFLNTTVDAKLYAQTGASSQNVPLLLRRSGYNAKSAMKNEREFFPVSGVSYVVVKVTRGCSPLDPEQRMQMKKRHRGRLIKLLKKYTSKLENAVE